MNQKYLVWIENVAEPLDELGGHLIELFDIYGGEIPEGWAIMNGESNCNPGSGIDKSDKFGPLPTSSRVLDEYCGEGEE